jgi:hypothetical protein
LPYIAWVSVAATLNYYIWILNVWSGKCVLNKKYSASVLIIISSVF